jgi:hypothetical protein
VGAGYDVEIISADQVRGTGERYKALFMATPVVSDSILAGKLTSDLHGGGVVIAEAPFAEVDPWGKPIAPIQNGLDKLFGVSADKPYDDGAENAIPGLGFDGKGRSVFQVDGAKSIGNFADGTKRPARS